MRVAILGCCVCVCVCVHVLWCLLHGQEIVVSLLLLFVCVSSKARLLLQTGNHITIGEAQFKLTYLLEKGEKKTLVHSLCSTNAVQSQDSHILGLVFVGFCKQSCNHPTSQVKTIRVIL